MCANLVMCTLNRIYFICQYFLNKVIPWIWPRGYKIFSMLNSAEHEIFPAHKCDNWHFSIISRKNSILGLSEAVKCLISRYFLSYENLKFHAQLR